MPRARRKPVPLTVSRPALLRGGSDGEFRALIHDLIAYARRLDACRDAFAAIVGVSAAQYEIVMLLSRAEGPTVGEAASRLHRSGAFITIEANKLAARGIVEKSADPHDGRRVRLRLAARGWQLVERLAPHQRRINDVLFEGVDARRFARLRALAAGLLASGDRAVAMLATLPREAEAA